MNSFAYNPDRSVTVGLVGVFYELRLEVVAGNQRRAVEDVCATNKARVWVAEVDGTAVGFVAVEI
jgi:hypothetical protein